MALQGTKTDVTTDSAGDTLYDGSSSTQLRAVRVIAATDLEIHIAGVIEWGSMLAGESEVFFFKPARAGGNVLKARSPSGAGSVRWYGVG